MEESCVAGSPPYFFFEFGVGHTCRAKSFDELVQFLMIYRRREGFCRQEVQGRTSEKRQDD